MQLRYANVELRDARDRGRNADHPDRPRHGRSGIDFHAQRASVRASGNCSNARSRRHSSSATIVGEFDVSPADAARDVAEFLDSLRAAGLIAPVEG